MAKGKFSPGDIVILKSGGPDMTILSIDDVSESGTVYYACAWFAGKKKEHGRFPEASLREAGPAAKGV